MGKRKKSNLTPHNSMTEKQKSSIGFGAFEFFKNIARKYGIFRKGGNLPALIFIRSTGKRIGIKSVKPDCVISTNNYFTFHLSLFFKIIRQLMKLQGNRYQHYTNSIFGRELLMHLASDRISFLYSMKDTGSLNYDSEPFLQETLVFLKMQGIKKESLSVRKVLQVHDSSRDAFSGSNMRTFLRDMDFFSQLKDLNSLRRIIPNSIIGSRKSSGFPPLMRKGADEDLFRMNTPVEQETGKFSLITYTTNQSIIPDTVNSHFMHYLYNWNVSRVATAGYLPFRKPSDRETIISLKPQNTAVSYLHGNFYFGGSISQKTDIPPDMKKSKERPQTESPHPQNSAFPRLVSFSHLRQNKYVRKMYHGNISKEPAFGYFQFQSTLKHDTNITLNPQNIVVSHLWGSSSTSQNTIILPTVKKSKERQTEFQQISVHIVENPDFHGNNDREPTGFNSFSHVSYPGYAIKKTNPDAQGLNELSKYENSSSGHPLSLKNSIFQSIFNRMVIPGTGFFSCLISRQKNISLEHQNTAIKYLNKKESKTGRSPPIWELYNTDNIVNPMRSDNSLLIHNRAFRNIHYKNKFEDVFFPYPDLNDGTPKITLIHSNPIVVALPRKTIARIGDQVHYMAAIQDGGQTSYNDVHSIETFSKTKPGFNMAGGAKFSSSHPGHVQMDEIQMSFDAPGIHPTRIANSGKDDPEYSMNVLSSRIRHSGIGGQYPGPGEKITELRGEETLFFQHKKTLQKRINRNMPLGRKNSNLTLSTRKLSNTNKQANPVNDNIYFRKFKNSGYGDSIKLKNNYIYAVKSDTQRNLAELVLKKSTVQNTGSGAGNKETIQSGGTTSTKTSENLIKGSFKQKPPQELSIIAERVYKIIERKLSTEKDRRGLL